jgi:hypothetical protein
MLQILHFNKPCGNTGNICILYVAEQINDVNSTSSTKRSSWRDDDDDDTHITMIL